MRTQHTRPFIVFLASVLLLTFVVPLHAQDTGTTALPSIDVEKYISVDTLTWADADTLPGPSVALAQTVSFRFVVTNNGGVPLTGITLTDNMFDLSGCPVPTSLEAGAFFECTAGPFPAVAGQHTNAATATGTYQTTIVSDVDGANYFGGDRPAIDVEKYVSSDGTTWADVDAAPGPRLLTGSTVSFRFVITNTGTTPLANISLIDNVISLAACAQPAVLNAGESAECIVGGVTVTEGQHSNVATVQADFNGVIVTDSDSAYYLGGDTLLPVTIIIEGPVQEININIITIYDIDIQVAVDDPILTVIQIGDFVRVEGDLITDDDDDDDGSTTIIVIAIFVTIIDVDVYINVGGEVWRDEGNCANGPPPWAPAHGWRRRCEGQQGNGNGNGRGRGGN